MNAKNPFHIAAFLLLTSIALWLALVVSQGFFLTNISQAPDYCVKWASIPEDVDAPERLVGSSSRCVEFVNTLEQLKYFHNLHMVERNRFLFYGVAILGFILAAVAFYALPKWRRTEYANAPNALGIALFLGFILVFTPMLLGLVLPSPSRWSPDAMNRYFESRRAAALEQLIDLASTRELQQRSKP